MKKLLVVDDERDIEHLYNLFMRKEISNGEVNLTFAFSADEAIKTLGDLNPMDIVLVLSDINMPGMSGLEMLKIIKEKYPHLNVFMVSAYGDEENKNTAQSYGASDFLVKPINFQLLKEKISHLKAA